MPTRTGNFAIGFRKGWSSWQRDTDTLVQWARDTGFEAIDLGQPTAEETAVVTRAGLRLGTVDLPGGWTSADPEKRQAALERTVAYIREQAQQGATLFFTIIPGEAGKSPAENYKNALEGFAPVAEAAAQVNTHIVIEGWPGGGPHLANLACNPETYRALIRDIGQPSVAINYDPSHLIRMGIDPIRFVAEFAPHIKHVHGKDTERIPEAVYEYGLYQGSVFARGHGFGEHVWRYTIPGHGETRWSKAFAILAESGFTGIVSVELEDENFNGSEEGEKAGLLHSLAFLKSA